MFLSSLSVIYKYGQHFTSRNSYKQNVVQDFRNKVCKKGIKMKIQLTFLIVCVVAIFALPERSSSGNSRNELTEEKEQGTDIQILSNGSVDADDEDSQSDVLDETNALSPSNETSTEKSRCDWIRRRHNRRNWLRRGQVEGNRNRTELTNNGEETIRHPYSVWQERQALNSERNSEAGGIYSAHHRHHHRHHHHHHRNRTTTTTPATTTTPSSINPSSEIER